MHHNRVEVNEFNQKELGGMMGTGEENMRSSEVEMESRRGNSANPT